MDKEEALLLSSDGFWINGTKRRSLEREIQKPYETSMAVMPPLGHNSHCLNFDPDLIRDKPGYLDRGRDRRLTRPILVPDLLDGHHIVHVLNIDRHFDAVVQGHAGLGKDRSHLLKDVPCLRLHIARSDRVPVFVSRSHARCKNKVVPRRQHCLGCRGGRPQSDHPAYR